MALGDVHKNGNIHHAHTGSAVFACSFVSGVVLCSLLHYCGCSSFLGGLGFCIRRYRQTNCQATAVTSVSRRENLLVFCIILLPFQNYIPNAKVWIAVAFVPRIQIKILRPGRPAGWKQRVRIDDNFIRRQRFPVPQRACHNQQAGIRHFIGTGTQCQKPFVCAGIIARGIKRALGHFIQVFLLCRIIGKVHILVKVEHIAIAFARGNCINCHDLVVLAAVQVSSSMTGCS